MRVEIGPFGRFQNGDKLRNYTSKGRVTIYVSRIEEESKEIRSSFDGGVPISSEIKAAPLLPLRDMGQCKAR